jgi:hypothetical protein
LRRLLDCADPRPGFQLRNILFPLDIVENSLLLSAAFLQQPSRILDRAAPRSQRGIEQEDARRMIERPKSSAGRSIA